jgi:hypothetical protein
LHQNLGKAIALGLAQSPLQGGPVLGLYAVCIAQGTVEDSLMPSLKTMDFAHCAVDDEPVRVYGLTLLVHSLFEEGAALLLGTSVLA